MSSNLSSSQSIDNYQQNIDFSRAVMLANSRQSQEAYKLFKELSKSTLGNWNPNVWLWIASLTKDFNEGQAALQRARQLGPLHPDLARAQQDFSSRRRKILFWRYCGLVGMVLCSFIMIFSIFYIRQFWPFATPARSGLYLGAIFSDVRTSEIFWLAIFGLIGSLVIWLKQQTFVSMLKPVSIVLVTAVFIVSLNWLFLKNDTSWEQVYHNSIQVGNNSYVLESRSQSVRFFTSNFSYRMPDFYVYKCDKSGIFCQLFETVNNSERLTKVNNNYNQYYRLSKNDYVIWYNKTNNSLEIERSATRKDITYINYTISLN